MVLLGQTHVLPDVCLVHLKICASKHFLHRAHRSEAPVVYGGSCPVKNEGLEIAVVLRELWTFVRHFLAPPLNRRFKQGLYPVKLGPLP